MLKIKDFNNFNNLDNILSTHDAFRHARYALEIQSGSYSKIDYLSDVPDFTVNQYPPPLLSQLTVWLSQITGMEIRYFFIYLPPILAVFFILPFYYWMKPIFNAYAFIGGITLTLFSQNYFSRTTLGYFDTDCLMLFFVFLIVAFISMSSQAKDDTVRSCFYITLASLSILIFRWWYEHLFMTVFFIISLFISLVVWRHTLRGILIKMTFFVIILNPIELFQYILTNPFIRDYFFGNLMNLETFKMKIDVYSTIAENKPVSIDAFINHTTGNFYTALLGTVIFLLFLKNNFKYIISALPFMLIGFSVFLTGYRYLIFSAPFVGIGIGYAIYLLKEFIYKRYNLSPNMLGISSMILIVFFTIPPEIFRYETRPILSERESFDIRKIRDLTEDGAYIWSWWDIGNPIQYLSGRGVFVDNISFNQDKLFNILTSFTVNNEEKSIQAFKNIQQLSINSSSQNYNRFNNSVYFFLNDTLLRKAIARGINTTKEEKEIFFRKFPSYTFTCRVDYNTADCDGITINIKDSKINISDNNIKKGYRKIVYINKLDKSNIEIDLNLKSNNIMVLIYALDKSMHQLIAHNDFEDTMIYKMFIRIEDNFKHFNLIYDDFPYMVLYKVVCKD